MSPPSPPPEPATGRAFAEPPPEAIPFNLSVLYRLCVYITRDLHAALNLKLIQHPEIPHEGAWTRLHNAYWQAVAAITGRNQTAVEGRGRESVQELPLMAVRLANAIDAMQREIETTDWGRRLFPSSTPDLCEPLTRELRRLLKLLL